MRHVISLAAVGVLVASLSLGTIYAQSQDKYALKVPGGLAFSEFRGYESWQTIAISENGPVIAVIVGNPQMIEAFQAGIPENGKPFPDGAKMAKIHWIPKKSTNPGNPTVPDKLANVDFMVKDSRTARGSRTAAVGDTARSSTTPRPTRSGRARRRIRRRNRTMRNVASVATRSRRRRTTCLRSTRAASRDSVRLADAAGAAVVLLAHVLEQAELAPLGTRRDLELL